MSLPDRQAAAASDPDVSVVLCTYNRAELLTQTLSSLARQQMNGKPWEIIVVDDGSTDRTAQVVEIARCEAAVPIRYFRQANTGIGNARNCGIRQSRAPWVAFIDDDEIASEIWLRELLRTAKDLNADCVGGPSILQVTGPSDIRPVGTVRMLLGQNPTMMGSHVRLSIFERLRFRAGRLAVPGAGNALVRKSLVRDLHGFRPLRYGEDLDFFRRAEQRGARLAVCPTATIEHLISPDRLEPGYLYSTARRAGATQATIDKGGGWWIRYVVALLRLAHMSTITLPSLAWHLARRDKSQIVSKRSSLHFAAGYILNVLGGQASVPQITVRGETP